MLLSQQEVEDGIQKECCSQFHLRHSAPISNTLLGHELQYFTDAKIAQQVLSGTYPLAIAFIMQKSGSGGP